MAHDTSAASAAAGDAHPDVVADWDVIQQIFGDLTHQRRWVCWRYEERRGRLTKVPIQPGGAFARVDDPDTWSTLARCMIYAKATPGVGVGIVFNGDGLIGVDLDKCLDGTGQPDADAESIVADLASYTERTPSGRGLHVICRGELPGGATGARRGNIEVYGVGRFFTVTGLHVDGSPDEVTEAQEPLERLWAKLEAHSARAAGEGAAAYQAGTGADTPWRRLNTAALERLGAWAPALFGDAARFVPGKDGYRVPAAALGREDLEEDLAIMPHGIRDWGLNDLGPDGADYGRQGKRTPLDLVLMFGGAADELQAAGWLAEKLGKRLVEDFGFEEPAARKQRRKRSSAPEEAGSAPAGDRPLVRIAGGRLHEQAEQAERHLAAATHADPARGVYVRGSMLVRAARLKGEKTGHGISRPVGSLVLVPAEADYLRGRLTEICRWERFDKKASEWVPTDAHEATVKSLLAAMPWERLPGLTGIIEAPTLRPDGSLLDKPGYDEATGLLFVAGTTIFPAIPDKPTREQAKAALELLKQPLAAFPFADEAARAVAISSVMTVLVRRVLRAAPMHAFTAPKMASGKTLLATIPSYVATGRAPYLISQATDPESERKRLLAALIEGPPLIVIDNVEKALKSDALSTVLTEPTFTDRLLGASRTLTVPTNCMMAATGNNLVLHGDLSARGLLCELDPACERPEEREFDLDLHEWVPAHRGELAAAALTIMRAYLAAGAPKQGIPNYARFEIWSRWVRSPLVWLGMPDPCTTRAKIETSDPVREQLRGLLAAWRRVCPKSGATVKEAIALGIREGNEDLHTALVTVAEGNEHGVNSRKVGRFIAAYEQRVEGDYRFEKLGTRQNAVIWRAVGVGEFGESGEFFPYDTRENANKDKTAKPTDQWETNSQNAPNSPPEDDDGWRDFETAGEP